MVQTPLGVSRSCPSVASSPPPPPSPPPSTTTVTTHVRETEEMTTTLGIIDDDDGGAPIKVKRKPVPIQENWDDDFDFGNEDNDDDDNHNDQHDALAVAAADDVRIAAGRSDRHHLRHPRDVRNGEDEDEDDWNVGSGGNDKVHVAATALSTIKQQTARAPLPPQQPPIVTAKTTENWDDDFLDDDEEDDSGVMDDSFPSPTARLPLQSSRDEEPAGSVENWDEEFEDSAGPSKPRPPSTDPFTSTISDSTSPDWISSSHIDKDNYSRSQTPRFSLDFDRDGSRSELGFYQRDPLDVEDRTMMKRRPRQLSNVSPVPQIIPVPFQQHRQSMHATSPTTSEFSMPRTAGESIYSYTGLLAYRSTPTIGLRGHLPSNSTPPTPQRPRRRLKKKQRPGVTQLDDLGIYELQDQRIMEHDESEPTHISPPRTPSPRPRSPTGVEAFTPSSPPSGPRSPLGALSRMSSMKSKFRRSRASTGPSTVIATEQQQQQRAAAAARTSWFLKAVGTPDLKKFKSKDHLRPSTAAAAGDETPKGGRIGGGGRSRSNTTGSVPDALVPLPDSKRHLSLQPPFRSSSPLNPNFPHNHPHPHPPLSKSSIHPPVSRGGSVKSKAPTPPAPAPPAAITTPVPEPPSSPRSGYRALMMGGVRRLSLVGRHKRQQTKNDNSPEHAPSQTTPSSARPSMSVSVFTTSPNSAASSSPGLALLGPAFELKQPSTSATETLPTPSTSTPSLSKLTANAVPPPVNRQLTVPGSPQAASLGRVNGLSGNVANGGPHGMMMNGQAVMGPRRSSLGDLKIPSRISKAQSGIKRDLSMVREFASCVEQIKQHLSEHISVVDEIEKGGSNNTTPVTPIQYHLPMRASHSSVSLAEQHSVTVAQLRKVEAKYAKWFEAAQVLINLASGPTPDTPTLPDTVVSPTPVPADGMPPPSRRHDRSRTIDVPISSWKSSMGRNAEEGLSERQLAILREMLDTPNGQLKDLPETSNRSIAKQYPAASTTTLPSVENGVPVVAMEGNGKGGGGGGDAKKRGGRLQGLKNVLRGLTKNHSEDNHNTPTNSTSNNRQPSGSTMPTTNSSSSALSFVPDEDGPDHPAVVHVDSQTLNYLQPHVQRAIELRAHPNSPYGSLAVDLTSPPTKSPRRPSLASIFRIGSGTKAKHPPHPHGNGNAKMDPSAGVYPRNSITDDDDALEDDWDHMDSSPMALPEKRLADLSTVRDKKKPSPSVSKTNTPKKKSQSNLGRHFRQKSNTSQVSLRDTGIHVSTPTLLSSQTQLPTTTILRSVSAHVPNVATRRTSRSPSESALMAGGSVRSAPPISSATFIPEPRLLLTPENIQPLLGYARRVESELGKCVKEVKLVLQPSSQSQSPHQSNVIVAGSALSSPLMQGQPATIVVH